MDSLLFVFVKIVTYLYNIAALSMRIVFCKIFVFVFDLIPLIVTILDVNFKFLYKFLHRAPLCLLLLFLFTAVVLLHDRSYRDENETKQTVCQ